MKVRLHRKPEIGCLYPECFPNTLDFRRHSTLILECEKMLDYGIAKDQIYTAVTELCEVRCVTAERLDVRVQLLFGGEV